MANQKTFKITCTLANIAYNVVTGTPVAPTMAQAQSKDNKGAALTFQSQTAGNNVIVGGSDVVSLGGISVVGPSADSPAGFSATPYTLPPTTSVSAYNAADWWVSSPFPGGVVIVQLIKSI